MDFKDIFSDVYGITLSVCNELSGKVLIQYHVLIDNQGKKYFLKKYPQKIKQEVELKDVNNILYVNDILIEQGIKTPKMIRTLDGNGGFIYHGNIYSLFEFMDLTNRCEKINMYEAGAFLAKLHHILNNIQLKDYDTWSPTVFDYQLNMNTYAKCNKYLFTKSSLLAEEKKYLDIREDIDEYLVKYSSYLDKVKKKQLIHGDLYSGNVIKVNNEIGIIDLDTVHYGNCIIDYTVMSMISFVNAECNTDIMIQQYKSFKDGYASNENWSSDLLYETIIYELLSQLFSVVLNWKTTYRFTSCRRAMDFFCNRLNYFINNKEFFVNFL